MIKLIDGMLLYHGSYIVIKDINLSKCKKGLDFGQGFYLTSSYQQAVNYIQLAVKKASRLHIIDADYNPDDGFLSVYRFHSDPNLLHHCFQTADAEWLHFVAANRETSLFPKLLAKYSTADIISGKIADDQTAKTLMQYIGKFYGTPGSPEADRAAIKQLIPDRLQDQFCFKTQDAINCLEFVRSERYGDIRL